MVNVKEISFEKYYRALERKRLYRDIGKVTSVTGFLIRAYIPGVAIGSLCEIRPGVGSPFLAEVIGFRDREVLLLPQGQMGSVGPGAKVVLHRLQSLVPVGRELLGRVIDSLGQPLDQKPPPRGEEEVSIYGESMNPMLREPICEPLSVGIRSIDGCITIGRGQRVAIMAGSGVGKSVLLGSMARGSQADVNVIALVGERGREGREFIENVLGEDGLAKSVVVLATSEQSALLRMRAAFVACSISEYFSSLGMNVLLMMDSVTRFAMAQREVGLNLGEPPATKGYTPSVFALLPRLLERAGNFEKRGSITGFYTVLVEGDDMDEPIADSVRSIVDGHIVLTRSLAHKGHFPAIDVLQSTSRVMSQVTTPEHMEAAIRFREILATYHEAEDLIQIGAYKQGSSAKIDAAIRSIDGVNRFLRQKVGQSSEFEQTLEDLYSLFPEVR